MDGTPPAGRWRPRLTAARAWLAFTPCLRARPLLLAAAPGTRSTVELAVLDGGAQAGVVANGTAGEDPAVAATAREKKEVVEALSARTASTGSHS